MRESGKNMGKSFFGPVVALNKGSVGPTLSDLQFMQQNERKQHEQTYIYENGHNDGSAPGWRSSF